MQFAVQSIAWGKYGPTLGTMLRAAKEAGYTGVELFQDYASSPYAVFDAFSEEQMTLTGLTFGSLAERLSFAREYARLLGVSVSDNRAPYVYVDQWDERCVEAINNGIRIGLHPHMFRPIQTLMEASKLLDQFDKNHFPSLEFIPDTAHLTAAGADPVEAIRMHFSRTKAIHLKDWTPNAGRSYQFYASGFCHLGSGDARIRDVLMSLWARSPPFEGWLVIEHDFCPDPFDSIKNSIDWISKLLPPRERAH